MMLHSLVGLLLLSLATTGFRCAVASSSDPVRWRLPLGAGPGENSGTLALASDDRSLYTADTRGTIFAIEASSGRLRWSIPGSNTLDQIFAFPSIPELLYYSTLDVSIVEQLSLHAVRKSDGFEVARLGNLSTGSIWGPPYAKVVPTEYGLAILHDYGLYSTDSYLNVQWKIVNPLGNTQSGPWFSHLASSGTIIATVLRTSVEVEGNTVSFDAKTGQVICNLSNITSNIIEDADPKIPFVISEDGWSILDETVGSPDAAFVFPRAVDLKRCAAYPLQYSGSKVAGGQGSSVPVSDNVVVLPLWSGVTIIPRTNYSDPSERTFFFGLSRAQLNANGTLFGNWTITHSTIGSNDTLWNMTLPAMVVNPVIIGGLGIPPVITKASGVPDAVLLWYQGVFSAIDVATGAVRWSLAPTTVPTSPPFSLMDPQTVFPLGDGGRVFVPNLLGYVVVDTYSGEALEVNFSEPILATLQFRDSSGSGYVVYVNIFGAAVCFR